MLQLGLRRLGFDAGTGPFFDTLRVRTKGRDQGQAIVARARQKGVNLRAYDDGSVGIALDETARPEELSVLFEAFSGGAVPFVAEQLAAEVEVALPDVHARRSPFLTHPVFNRHHSETEMLRYLSRLQARDLSLAQSMIPLGSCTMKLNATSEMIPVTWPQLGGLHPFAPADQAKGYHEMFAQLEAWLAEITGFAAVSLQPNSGAQGEYAGLLAIRAYHRSRGRRAPRRVPHPRLRPRHEPGERGDGRLQGGGGRLRRARQRRRRRPHGEGRAARAGTRRADGDVPVDARRLRGGDPRDLRRRPRARRPGLHGRREHERAGRPHAARRHRRRRVPPQPAQDVLHPARRRRPGHGPDRRRGAPRPVPAGPPRRGHRRREEPRPGLRGAVGQREHPLHLVDVHPR